MVLARILLPSKGEAIFTSAYAQQFGCVYFVRRRIYLFRAISLQFCYFTLQSKYSNTVENYCYIQ